MATRVVHFNSATDRTTTTSSTYGDKVALTFTPDDNSTYALLWSADSDINSITADQQVRLQHDTASNTLCELRYESKDTSDIASCGGVAYATFGASPGSQTFSIEFAAESGTVGLQQAYLIAIKLTANDKFATASATNTTSTSPQTVATVTWTPGSTGDYVIIGSAGVGSTTDDQASVQLFDGTTTYGICSPLSYDGNADNRQPWFHAVYASGLSGSQTWSVRYNAVSSDTINISNSFIVALRVDDWPAAYQTADRARATTTNATFTDRSTLTQTTEAGDHVEIAVSVLDRASTTNSLEWQLTRDAATVGVASLRETVTNTTTKNPGYLALVSTLSAASHTWKTQYRGESGSTETGITDSAIIVLQIEEAAGDVTAQPTSGALVFVGAAPTVSAGATLSPSQGTFAVAGQTATFTAATDVNALPASGTVDIVGAAPTVSTSSAVAPNAGSLDFAGVAPTVSAGASLEAAAGALDAAGQAPTVSASSTAEPSQGALAVTGAAPTVSASATVEPGSGAITVTGLAPTVGVAANVDAQPDPGAISVDGLAPTLSAGATLATQTGSVEVTGFAPGVSAASSVQPTAGDVQITGLAPTVEVAGNVTAEPQTGSLAVSGLAPDVAGSASLAPNAGSVVLSGLSPDVAAHFSASPDVGEITLAGASPTVSASSQANPASGAVVITGHAPTVEVAADGESLPGAGSLEVAGAPPSLAASSSVELGAGQAVVAGHEPIVTTGADVTAQPQSGAIAVSGQAPTVSASQSLEPAAGTVVITGYAPTVSGGADVLLTTGAGSLVVVGNAPTFAGHFAAAANDATLVIAGFAPEVSTEHQIVVQAGSIAITGYAPLIIKIPPPDRRIVPVGERDRQFAVSGRRRQFKVGPRGGTPAA